jgi:hypothetical protein
MSVLTGLGFWVFTAVDRLELQREWEPSEKPSLSQGGGVRKFDRPQKPPPFLASWPHLRAAVRARRSFVTMHQGDGVAPKADSP